MSKLNLKKVVENALNNPSDINHLYLDGVNKTPLLYAIECGDIASVQILIENGAYINRQGLAQTSPLALAVQESHREIASYLLEKGAEAGAHGIKQKRPLYYAIQQENLELVKLLLPKLINHHTLPCSLVQAVEMNNPRIVRTLIRYGASPNRVNSNGVYPIMAAIEQRNLHILKVLHRGGADLNRRNLPSSDAPIIKAARMINFPVVKFLVKNKAKVNVVTPEGETALRFALQTEDFRTVQLLIEAGIELRVERCEVDRVIKINPDFAAYIEEFERGMRSKKVKVRAGPSN